MDQDRKIKGYICGIIAVTIWAGWAIVSKLGINSNLSAFDITFLRFSTASIFLLPIFLKNRKQIFSQDKSKLAFIVIGAGAPYMFLAGIGFTLSPSSHSVLIPSHMPVFYALIAYVILKEVPSNIRKFGLLLIISGAMIKLSTSFDNATYFKGDLFFIFSALMWAGYTFNLKQSSLKPLAATALISVGSVALMIVPYAIYQFVRPHEINIQNAMLQILYQGIVMSIISSVLYNKAIEMIGASVATSLSALVPMLTSIFSYLILGEIPGFYDHIFNIMATIGVILCSGVIKTGHFRKQRS